MRVSIVVAVALSACLSSSPPQLLDDGASCGSDDDCVSFECRGGLCVGSLCDATDPCPGGFDCVPDDGPFNIFESSLCQMRCGFDATGSAGCPDGFTCDGTYCDYVGQQLVASYSPAQPMANLPIAFTARVMLGGAGTDFAWIFSSADFSITGSAAGPTATVGFPAGDYFYAVTARVDGQAQLANGHFTICEPSSDGTCP